MKSIKTLRLSICIIILSINTYAQKEKGFSFNIGTGINFSTIYNDAGDTYPNTRESFQASITFEYYFNNRWSLKSGLVYDSKGVDILNLNYLFIPLYANWHFGTNRNWYLNFGPYLDLFLPSKSNPLHSHIQSTDFGLATGIGYQFNIAKKTKLFLEFQQAVGFKNIFKSSELEGYNIRNSFNIGFSFDL